MPGSPRSRLRGALQTTSGPSGYSITNAGGIVSAQAFGTPSVSPRLSPTGIPSAEAFGVPSVSVRLDLIGIPGAEAFGSPTLTVAYEITGAGGIVSAEAFGSPVVTLLGVIERKSLRFLGWPTPYGVSIARRRKR